MVEERADLVGKSPKAIARRIQATIQALEMSQRQFAIECGIGPTALGNYLAYLKPKPPASARRPRLEAVRLMANYIGGGIGWFYEGNKRDLPGDLSLIIYGGAAIDATPGKDRKGRARRERA